MITYHASSLIAVMWKPRASCLNECHSSNMNAKTGVENTSDEQSSTGLWRGSRVNTARWPDLDKQNPKDINRLIDGWEREKSRNTKGPIACSFASASLFAACTVLHPGGLKLMLYNPGSYAFQHSVGLSQWESLEGDQQAKGESSGRCILLPACFDMSVLTGCVP